MRETAPSENEWFIMEAIWNSGSTMTASDVIRSVKGALDVSPKTIRVMINRLVAKGLLRYTVDAEDARVYHYEAVKSKEQCLEMKSRRFINNYFGGDTTLAVASFLRSANLDEGQLEELKKMVREL